MSIGDSSTAIANIGLVALGQDVITSINQGGKAANLCLARYDQSRRAALRGSLWGCARRPCTLPASAVSLPFGGDTVYPLPADWIRWAWPHEHHESRHWQIANIENVGNAVLGRFGAQLDGWYIFDLQDCTQMDALLTETIGYALASAIAIGLAVDRTLKSLAQQEYEARLAIARTVYAQEQSSPQFHDDVLLRSRR